MNIGLFDSHAHYFDRRFDEIGGGDKVLTEEVFGGDVAYVINVGTNDVTNRLCIEQAKKYDGMYVAAGIHPEDVRGCESTLGVELDKLSLLLGDRDDQRANKIVALGEIGLDYHYEGYNKALQAECFDSQMCMAKEKKLPVIIHDREAHGDCFDIIIAHPDITGVFHSYSGSAEMARDLVRRGWYISFSGVATFKNAPKVREAIAAVPLERILIETDAPYLAPHPFRGRINNSALMKYTAAAVADVKGVSTDEIIEITCKNAIDLFLKMG